MRFLRDALITILAIIVLVFVVGYIWLATTGLSAAAEPGKVETAMARRIRGLSIPSSMKAKANPFASRPSAWIEGGHHFEEHCSVCHGDDGKGDAEIGRYMYPKAPNMAEAATQQLTDGELFYIIQNGVRFTGMPAWSREHSAEDTWKLVSFIRHIPKLTPADVDELTSMPDMDHDHGHEQGHDEHAGEHGAGEHAGKTPKTPEKPPRQDHHEHQVH